MRTKKFLPMLFTLILIIALLGCPPTPKHACVDFEPPLVYGTQYGVPAGNSPGDVVFTTNGVRVSVENFDYVGTGSTFNLAYIDTATSFFGKGQTIRTNNINLKFDFSNVGFKVAEVNLEFLDLGGSENLSVNGSTIYAGELTSAPSPMGGVTLMFTTTPVPGGEKGKLTMKGAVKTLIIGGQEFWLDNVCAKN
jgi:hypothetical protein